MSNEPEKVITPIRNAISEGEVDKQVTHYDKMNDDLRNSETVLNIGQEPTNGEEEKKEDDVSNQHLDPKKETVDAATKTKTDDAAATKTAKHEDKANENTTSDASDNDKEAHTQSRGIDPPEEGKVNNTNSCNHHVPKDVTVPNNNSVLSLLDQASNMNPSAIANVPDGNEETEAFKSLLDSAAKTATNHFDKRFDENRDEARGRFDTLDAITEETKANTDKIVKDGAKESSLERLGQMLEQINTKLDTNKEELNTKLDTDKEELNTKLDTNKEELISSHNEKKEELQAYLKQSKRGALAKMKDMLP